MTWNWVKIHKHVIKGKKEKGKKSSTLSPNHKKHVKKGKGRNTRINTLTINTFSSDNGSSQNRCNMCLLQHHEHLLRLNCPQNKTKRAFITFHYPCHVSTSMKKIVDLLVQTPKYLNGLEARSRSC
jgi:hypothetical protein